MTRHRTILVVIGAAVVAVVASLALGGTGGAARAADRTDTARSAVQNAAQRDFMFQALNVKTRNQGGHTLNLFFHYRYNQGIADRDIPDYTTLRTQALHYLATTDLSKNPYWEVLNHQLCADLKQDYPIQAISCELQVKGVENPGPNDEPGYRASVETFGNIDPLAIFGPTNP